MKALGMLGALTGTLMAQSGLVLDMGAGPEAWALAGAFTGRAKGPYALFWNPGGLAQADGLGFLASHCEYFQGIRFEHMGVSLPLGPGALGVGLGGLFVPGIEGRDESGAPTGEFTYWDAFGVLGYGVGGVGASVKAYFSSAGDASGFALLGDLGGRVDLGPFGLGLALLNFGTGVKYLEEATDPPTSLRAGVEWGVGPLSLEADWHQPFKYQSGYLAFGGSYSLGNLATLRLGYSTELLGQEGFSTLSAFSFGLGVRLGMVDIDYAFRSYDVLGPTHRIGLSVWPARLERAAKAQAQELAEAIEQRCKETSESFVASARNAYRRGELHRAMEDLDRALVWDPENGSAAALYDTVQEAMRRARADSLLSAGIELYNQGNIPDAIRLFEQVLSIDPGNSLAQKWQETAFQALVELQVQRYKEAEARAQEVARYIKRGVRYYSQGKYSQAEAQFKKALSIDPQNPDAKRYLAMVAEARAERVRELLDRAAERERAGDLASAISLLVQAQALDSANQDVQTRLAQLRAEAAQEAQSLAQRGWDLLDENPSQASVLFKRALALDPNNQLAKRGLAKLRTKPKPKKEASPAEVEELYLKGVNAYMQGDYRGAIYWWERVLELDPNHQKAKSNIQRAKRRLESS